MEKNHHHLGEKVFVPFFPQTTKKVNSKNPGSRCQSTTILQNASIPLKDDD